MTPEALAAAISDALADVPEVPSDGVEVKVERPKNREHGDYATNVALVLAKRAGIPPRDLAAKIVEVLRANPGIEALDIAGPGFINITLAADAAGDPSPGCALGGALERLSDTRQVSHHCLGRPLPVGGFGDGCESRDAACDRQFGSSLLLCRSPFWCSY